MATLLNIGHFVAKASEYCRILESEACASKLEFRQVVLVSLVGLYEAGLALPDVQPQLSTLDSPAIDLNERVKFQNLLVDKLEGEHAYRMVFEPFNLNIWEGAVVATLADDLSDIYFDVKEGLMVIGKRSDIPVDIVWEWRFGFISHWGQHAVNAIHAIHSLLWGPDISGWRSENT